ncbi:Atrial natriuretic peptide receptor 2 [Labeo rohita]|uniref:guanylate cyclase n=1 Tax=Labeo rohita TaxID=84645 RepID=A0ABQ8LHR6_LABRO|nr:Atrial natriuretic peptide receptor 2 [Labeo rohita]
MRSYYICMVCFVACVFGWHDLDNNPAEARRFCEQHECPTDWKDANGENCCIHHANIHSCPMGFMKQAEERICGPWIPDDGRIFTHTISTSGKMTQTNWSAKVVLFHEGLTSLIAHIRVGNMQVALEAKSTVLPAITAIALTVTTIIISFIISAMWFKYQKQKLFWDESWIIDFNHIKQDYIARATMGSIMSVPAANSDSNASCVTALSSYTGTIRQEVKQVRELDHPNLCKFFGGCVEVPNIAIVTEYCPKGSLNDVLLNDEIPLNWGFRFSFATDIARGMSYLHQFKICHGRLKSANCVIDDRWVCKITDYCLWTFRREDCAEPLTTYQQRLKEVYTPPEAQNGSQEPTLAGDVFSYSIILLEIATRNDPVPLIRRCRAHNPAHRPVFEQIRKFVHRINPHKVSPVDMMMELMEKYSKHLEVLVGERTQDLMLEKQKTDRLLYRQTATSPNDIVGFTQLSSTSTPYQVVDFLNKLYTTFDEIIDNYDVYKVETIGDAYMVVSGVPRENGILHASEIASMALDLVRSSQELWEQRCRDTVCLETRAEDPVQLQYILPPGGDRRIHAHLQRSLTGQGDMVTYWLEGKRSAAPAKDVKKPVTLQESERPATVPDTHTDDYSSIPGVLSGSDSSDLLCDPI